LVVELGILAEGCDPFCKENSASCLVGFLQRILVLTIISEPQRGVDFAQLSPDRVDPRLEVSGRHVEHGAFSWLFGVNDELKVLCIIKPRSHFQGLFYVGLAHKNVVERTNERQAFSICSDEVEAFIESGLLRLWSYLRLSVIV
jgi:hypothetical protein